MAQVALTSICQEGLRWALTPSAESRGVQQARLPFLSGLSIVAARLTAAVAAQVAALATSLAEPLSPDEEDPDWEPFRALLEILSGQSKAKPAARCALWACTCIEVRVGAAVVVCCASSPEPRSTVFCSSSIGAEQCGDDMWMCCQRGPMAVCLCDARRCCDPAIRFHPVLESLQVAS